MERGGWLETGWVAGPAPHRPRFLTAVRNDSGRGEGREEHRQETPCPAVQFRGNEIRLDRKRLASRMIAWGNSSTERQYNAAGNTSGTATLYVYKPSHRHRSGAYPLIFVVEFQFFGRTAGLLEVSLFNWRTRSLQVHGDLFQCEQSDKAQGIARSTHNETWL